MYLAIVRNAQVVGRFCSSHFLSISRLWTEREQTSGQHICSVMNNGLEIECDRCNLTQFIFLLLFGCISHMRHTKKKNEQEVVAARLSLVALLVCFKRRRSIGLPLRQVDDTLDQRQINETSMGCKMW